MAMTPTRKIPTYRDRKLARQLQALKTEEHASSLYSMLLSINGIVTRYKPGPVSRINGELRAVKLKPETDKRTRRARTLPWSAGVVMGVVPAGARPQTYLPWRVRELQGARLTRKATPFARVLMHGKRFITLASLAAIRDLSQFNIQFMIERLGEADGALFKRAEQRPGGWHALGQDERGNEHFEKGTDH